jgi:hypothetical protein
VEDCSGSVNKYLCVYGKDHSLVTQVRLLYFWIDDSSPVVPLFKSIAGRQCDIDYDEFERVVSADHRLQLAPGLLDELKKAETLNKH